MVLALAGCNLGAPGVTYRTVDPDDFDRAIDPTRVVAGDVDEDGDADLVVVGSRGHMVFENDGSGAFTLGFIKTTFGVETPSLDDVDGDGHLDLVGVFPLGSDDFTGYLVGDGAGGFGSPVTFEPLSAPHPDRLSNLATADVDGDGDTDVLVTSWIASVPGRHVGVYLNDGTGTFGARTSYAVGLDSDTAYPVFLDTGDVDGDGDPDAIVTSGRWVDDPEIGSREVTIGAVALNDGTGAFAPTAAGDVEIGGMGFVWPLQPVFGDLDGDGDLDVAVGGFGSVTTMLGDGAGGFAAPVRTPVGVSGPIDHIEAVHVDEDGRLDLVGSYGPDEAVVVYGDGAGGVDAHHAVVPGSPGLLDLDLEAGDLDGDGDPDIVTVSQDNVIGVLENVTGRPEH
jgi:hypothetical protein